MTLGNNCSTSDVDERIQLRSEYMVYRRDLVNNVILPRWGSPSPSISCGGSNLETPGLPKYSLVPTPKHLFSWVRLIPQHPATASLPVLGRRRNCALLSISTKRQNTDHPRRGTRFTLSLRLKYSGAHCSPLTNVRSASAVFPIATSRIR